MLCLQCLKKGEPQYEFVLDGTTRTKNESLEPYNAKDLLNIQKGSSLDQSESSMLDSGEKLYSIAARNETMKEAGDSLGSSILDPTSKAVTKAQIQQKFDKYAKQESLEANQQSPTIEALSSANHKRKRRKKKKLDRPVTMEEEEVRKEQKTLRQGYGNTANKLFG